MLICTNVSKKEEEAIYGSVEKREYIFPRVYTSDNMPVLVAGIANNGGKIHHTSAIQDNENPNIEKYTMRIKSAKGCIERKGKVNKQTDIIEEQQNIEQPIELSFRDNTLEIKGNIQLEENEQFEEILPVIDTTCFSDCEYYIELEDGRKSDLTYGYKSKPNKSRVCLDIIQKIDKLKIIGNIKEKSIKCGEFNGTLETQENYFEMNPKEVERIELEDKILENLMEEDSKLDEQLKDKQQLLERYESQDKAVQQYEQEEL